MFGRVLNTPMAFITFFKVLHNDVKKYWARIFRYIETGNKSVNIQLYGITKGFNSIIGKMFKIDKK